VTVVDDLLQDPTVSLDALDRAHVVRRQLDDGEDLAGHDVQFRPPRTDLSALPQVRSGRLCDVLLCGLAEPGREGFAEPGLCSVVYPDHVAVGPNQDSNRGGDGSDDG